MTLKKVYFVRHGQSEANASEMREHHDAALTSHGEKQAEHARIRVAKLPIDVVIASTLIRAKKTAEIITGATGGDIEHDPRVNEWKHPDAIVGKAKSDGPFLLDLMNADSPVQKEFSGGETFLEMKTRTLSFMKSLESRPEEHILVVSHNVFMKMFFACSFFGEELNFEEFSQVVNHLRIDNTGISIFQFSAESHSAWRLVSWNDHAHL